MVKDSFYKHKWIYIFLTSLALCLLALCLLIIVISVKYGSLAGGMEYLAYYAFSDFGQVMYFTIDDNPYTASFGTMYTPINFLFYLPFSIICGANDAFYTLGIVSVEEYNYGILHTWEFWVSLICYYVIVFTALFFVLRKAIPAEKLSDKVAFFFALGFSTLIGFGFIRGSNIFITLIFFVAYVNWYKSDVRWKRELSLVFFAVAGTMKYYALFGGILLLKDKRWADVIKCVIYVFICLFVPFLFYSSPFETIAVYIENLFTFAGDEGRVGALNNISAYNLVYCFFSLFGVQDTAVVTVLCWLVTLCVFAFGIVICLKTRSRFSELIAISCVFALVAPVSYLYLLCFMILPFLEFEREKVCFGKKRKIFYYAAFFVLMFIPLMVLQFFLIYTMVLLAVLAVEFITVFKRDKKGNMPPELVEQL